MRGRPRVLAPEYEQALQQLFPDVQSRRHLQNVACRQRALVLLSDDPAYRWLCDPEAMLYHDADGRIVVWREESIKKPTE